MKILKTTDKVQVKIGDISFVVSPLKYAQKIELSSMVKSVQDGEEKPDIQARLAYVIKHCVKGVSGVTYADGSPVSLQFDENNILTDESHTDMMTAINGSVAHIMSMMTIAGGQLPGEIVDMVSGKKIKGAEVIINPK